MKKNDDNGIFLLLIGLNMLLLNMNFFFLSRDLKEIISILKDLAGN